MSMKRCAWGAAPGLTLAIALLLALSDPAMSAPLPTLKVSPDGRSLVQADGRPFFYLADTAWELFHRLNREQAVEYLDLRARQKYTVIQAVALAELDGLTDPNPYGDLPLIGKDPTKPAVTPGADPKDRQGYDYWDHVDFIVDEANKRGLYVALLPTWGRWVGGRPADESVLTTANAQAYGQFIGRRYREKSVIWVLGGDRPSEGHEEVWRLLAKGIAIGVAGKEDYDGLLMTFHPRGGGTSSASFHNDRWLDFNMLQTGHGPAAQVRGWDRISADYNRTPVKPVVDGEPLYEDHPVGFRAATEHGFSSDSHIRQRAYWHVFAGACGFTYGNHAVWQMYAPGRRAVNGPLFYWSEAIHRPGADQMQHVRALIASRPMLARVPDQSLVTDPLDGPNRIQACRGDGYAFIYTGAGRKFTVNLGKISGEQVKAWWYNPRNGAATEIGTLPNNGTREFTPQFEGFGSDWVLVLDDAAKGYAVPGGKGR